MLKRILKIVGKVIYGFLYVIVLITLLVILVQRISNNNISIAGIRFFSVASSSMFPEYEVGDIIIAKEVEPQEIKVGENVVYNGKKGEFKDKIITHEVVKIEEENGEYIFTTKGIANDESDPTISEDQVLGKIVYKSVVLSFLNKIVNNIYTFYFLIFVPITIIIAKNIIQISIENKSKEDDIDYKEETQKEESEEK